MKHIDPLSSTLIAIFCLVVGNTFAQSPRDSTRTSQRTDTSITGKTFTLSEIVVSASRMEEKLLQSPVSIEKMSSRDIRFSAQPSYFDALENIKGVQMIVPSLGFKVLNTRGFANTTNVRFVQLVDGMDNQAPHIGAPIASAMAPGDLDVESVEVIPGTASALYGMNAINGLANILTRNPFEHTGLSIQQKVGINHVADKQISPQLYSETALRYAQKLSSKLAFKINGSYTGGYDWIADDRADLFPNGNASAGLTGSDNPAIDPVNSYGNESANRRTLSLNGKNIVVARTGYAEKDVTDYHLRNWKGDIALHWRPVKGHEVIYAYRIAYLNSIYQRSNRFRLEDYLLGQYSIQWRAPGWQLRTYLTSENTRNSYNLRSMAENIDRGYKTDNTWFSDFTQGFTQAIAQDKSTIDALQVARQAADAGRPVPGTAAFQKQIDTLRTVNNWDIGAALRVKAYLFHIEGQANLGENLLKGFKNTSGIDINLGFDHRRYSIVPDGNYFINPTEPGKNLVYGKTGGFVQLNRSFAQSKVKVGLTLRWDKSDYFTLKWNPRVTVVYSPSEMHHFRTSFQSGYRFPSIFEGFSNVTSGGVKRVGGLPVMSNGIFENSYIRSSVDAFVSAVNAGVNKLGASKRDSLIVANAGLITRNTYTYLKPEKIQSLEVGYKGLWLDGDLYVDADFYYNYYQNFMAQIEANIPKGSNPDSLAFYMYDRTKQDRYRLWTNSKTTVYNYGASVGLRYMLTSDLSLRGNVSFSRLDHKTSNDGLEDGFNTPQWTLNMGIAHEHIWKGLGAGLTYKWQSRYYWQSFLVNGDVPSYSTVDAQVSYHFSGALDSRIGATNLFNHYYVSFLGGPQIGGFYYTTVTWNLPQKRDK
ncbi:TonB-dependent receptor [Xanthocytophaga agilis]|uniref:TonB-dependent receptor n=1 Tax=Xanthocytophaga agilis TaxID=3048010 RepID=A0AAE3UEH2_9BACT|nr:TonB-dependent receptor [Xanthocytophaga agilis]MDJ1500252.1 TonB-dependent receptor [Xanthocytophaga agilis]